MSEKQQQNNGNAPLLERATTNSPKKVTHASCKEINSSQPKAKHNHQQQQKQKQHMSQAVNVPVQQESQQQQQTASTNSINKLLAHPKPRRRKAKGIVSQLSREDKLSTKNSNAVSNDNNKITASQSKIVVTSPMINKSISIENKEECTKSNSEDLAPLLQSTMINEVKSEESKSPVSDVAETVTVTKPEELVDVASPVAIHQTDETKAPPSPIKTEESDEIDAGIELDGSSNSGSSIKDVSDEHAKMTSISPSQDTNESKKVPSKKQQLEANLKDIDADEKHLQLKMLKKLSVGSPITDSSFKVQRRFSSQASVESQELSTCRVCDKHVYQMERLKAEKSLYHKKCFRCTQCNVQLRIDSYASHEGEVYCKAHHRLRIQPQISVDNNNDVDIVEKSNETKVDDYLLHRGRLSDNSFSFLQNNSTEIGRKKMIICENQPDELPADVVRCDVKTDDGPLSLKINLSNIKERFELAANNSSLSSSFTPIDKPSINIKQTLMAFETKSKEILQQQLPNHNQNSPVTVRPLIKKLADGFLGRSISLDSEADEKCDDKEEKRNHASIGRSESLMERLRKYESRAAGISVDEDVSDDQEDDTLIENKRDTSDKHKTKANIDSESTSDLSHSESDNSISVKVTERVMRLQRSSETKNGASFTDADRKAFVKLSSLKSQWENGDILNKRSFDNDDDDEYIQQENEHERELHTIRQSLASKKKLFGDAKSIKQIYESAVDEKQKSIEKMKSQNANNIMNEVRNSSFKTTRQEFLNLQASEPKQNRNFNKQSHLAEFADLNKKTNKIRERFELGIVQKSDSEESLSTMDKIKMDKQEDLSVFNGGEIQAREARSLFQQIDKAHYNSSTPMHANGTR